MTGQPETPTLRARRIANWLLSKLDPADQAAIAEKAHAVGDTWLGAHLVVDDDGLSAITTTEAAQRTGVAPGTIRQWACTPHPYALGRMLLPRFGKRGRDQTYLWRDVQEAKKLAEQTPLRRARG